MPRVTSVDVARRAGVNQSTVSRAFADDRTISAVTRAKVLDAARDLGYTPNAIARGLITRRTGIVGIVMADITSPFQPYVLEKFIRALDESGRRALVFTAGPGQEVDDILPQALAYQVDALIVTSATLSSVRVAECARSGTPVLLFNRYLPGGDVSAVCCDNVAGGRAAADCLIDGGGVRLAYIAGSANSSTNRDRERGFMARVRERGAADPARVQAAYSYEAGRAAARALLARAAPPDAIFCASDITALGAMDELRAEGVRVPKDCALVGFDDIPMASWAAYSLTTIRQPVDAMIGATRDLLLDRIAAPDAAPVVTFLPGALIERDSTKRSNG